MWCYHLCREARHGGSNMANRSRSGRFPDPAIAPSLATHTRAIWGRALQAGPDSCSLPPFPPWFCPNTGSRCGPRYPEQAQKFVPPRNIKRMCRAGTKRAETQRIERNIQCDEAVLGNPENEASIKAGARKYASRKKQERSSPSGLFGFNPRDAPIAKIHPDSQTIKVLFRIILLQCFEKLVLRIARGAISRVTDKERSPSLFQGIDRSD